MSARWRDKKAEPGFVFHAWMGTVDELEDQIAELVAALKEAIAELNAWCEEASGESYNNPRFNDIIAKAEGRK